MASRRTVGRMMLLFKRTWIREVTESLMDIYHATFNDLSDEELWVGAWACVKESRFFPTPAEILERCGKHLGIEQAWSLVMKAERASDLPPAVRATVENMGGLKMIREGDFRWTYRDFRRAFPEIANRVRIVESLKDENLLPMIKKLVAKLEGRDLPALPSGEKDDV